MRIQSEYAPDSLLKGEIAHKHPPSLKLRWASRSAFGLTLLVCGTRRQRAGGALSLPSIIMRIQSEYAPDSLLKGEIAHKHPPSLKLRWASRSAFGLTLPVPGTRSVGPCADWKSAVPSAWMPTE